MIEAYHVKFSAPPGLTDVTSYAYQTADEEVIVERETKEHFRSARGWLEHISKRFVDMFGREITTHPINDLTASGLTGASFKFETAGAEEQKGVLVAIQRGDALLRWDYRTKNRDWPDIDTRFSPDLLNVAPVASVAPPTPRDFSRYVVSETGFDLPSSLFPPRRYHFQLPEDLLDVFVDLPKQDDMPDDGEHLLQELREGGFELDAVTTEQLFGHRICWTERRDPYDPSVVDQCCAAWTILARNKDGDPTLGAAITGVAEPKHQPVLKLSVEALLSTLQATT